MQWGSSWFSPFRNSPFPPSFCHFQQIPYPIAPYIASFSATHKLGLFNLKVFKQGEFFKEKKPVASKLSQCCLPCCCLWKCILLSLRILQNERNWKHLNGRLCSAEILVHAPRLPWSFSKQGDMFIRMVNHTHGVIYCQDYLRFPKINSNELYRNGRLEIERSDLYPGKEKKKKSS